jgi:ubiquinone/menaquinone biosynthesis C-methylase UbiE
MEASSMVLIDGKIDPKVARLWERFYCDYDPRRFGALVESFVNPSSRVLEVGAGSGRGPQNSFPLKGKAAQYVGIDLDPRVLDNPNLDKAFVCAAESLPFEDAEFDLVFHTMVAEHLPDPLAATREMARVLKVGGRLLCETPSRFYYPMLVASMTPHWFHELYVERCGSGRKSHDVFSTMYRLNDKKSILSVMAKVGLVPEIQFWSTPPGYLRFSRLSFLLGVLYERTVERAFPAARGRIVVIATKPG